MLHLRADVEVLLLPMRHDLPLSVFGARAQAIRLVPRRFGLLFGTRRSNGRDSALVTQLAELAHGVTTHVAARALEVALVDVEIIDVVDATHALERANRGQPRLVMRILGERLEAFFHLDELMLRNDGRRGGATIAGE